MKEPQSSNIWSRDVVDMRKYNPRREGNDRALHIKCLCGGIIKGIDNLSSF
jgi:hypothetical protein